ncbi:MAG: 3-phosphoshikimate 1-carboxyvinyltransferase [Chloroflexota bacterium]|nr:3-phosphoshikimate 1-carboxyvinyltransferase [Chloroflexota bacterium]MDE2684316.1 3-phosphoshikimate 1-carboxyvinyltransferase [Chloroflexota bacterium]
MEQTVRSPERLAGALAVPGDKSVSHRSLILNAIANGGATVTGISDGADVRSTAACLRAMGVSIEPLGEPGSFQVSGLGPNLQEPADMLDAGNSGTSMRLLSGLLASQDFLSVLTGDGSLRSRPMGRIVQPLQQMGASIMGRSGNTLAPLAIRGGNLRSIEYEMPVASAQVKSCLMLAGLSASGPTVLYQPALSRDHTERMMTAMGARVETDGLALTLHPADLQAVDVAVPGDISSAAFWMVAGLIHPNARVTITGVGLNPSRAGIIDALQMMGAGDSLLLENERVEGGEPVADVVASSANLKGIELGGEIIPIMIDELPVLAVAACFAEGDTIIRDAAELRVKESDRIATTVSELTRLGGKLEPRDDGMVIRGVGHLSGADVESHGDHRLAMSMAVAGLVASGDTVIHGAEDASVSYPTFWEHLASLTGET